jgi:4-amino-4-deoxy-L-arabinose transferase-like glycosyltransferase
LPALYIALFAIAAALSLWRLGDTPLMDIDESMYAEIARHMVDSGDWVTPTFDGAATFLKPPLYYWLVALSMKCVGQTEFAVRIVSGLLGLAAVALTALLGRWVFSRREGLLAGLILGLSPGFVLMIRVSTVDMTLTAFLTLAFYGYARMIAKAPDGRPAPDAISFLAMWLGAALATLTKGPIGLLIPALVVGLHGIATRRLKRLLGLWIPAGLALYFAIVLPWYVICTIRHGMEFLQENLLHHNLEKFFVKGIYHDKTNYFFLLKNFQWMFFPWILIMAVAALVRLVDLGRGPGRLARIGDAPLLFWIWFLAPTLVFSLSQYKLPTYIAPTLPACSLLVARWLDRGLRGDFWLAWLGKAALLLMTVGGLLVVYWCLARFFPISSVFARTLPLVALPIFALLSLLGGSERRRGAALALACATMFALEIVLVGYIQPQIHAYSPYREAGRLIRESARPGDEFFALRTGITGSLLFYTRCRFTWVHRDEQLRDVLANKNGLAIMEGPDYDKLPPELKDRLTPVATWPFYHVAKMTSKFLYAATRPAQISTLRLFRLKGAAPPIP